MKNFKKPRYQLSIIAQFRKHAFRESFRRHLTNLIDEIESEYDSSLLRFPGVKMAYFKEVGMNNRNKYKSTTSFTETFEDNLNNDTAKHN